MFGQISGLVTEVFELDVERQAFYATQECRDIRRILDGLMAKSLAAKAEKPSVPAETFDLKTVALNHALSTAAVVVGAIYKLPPVEQDRARRLLRMIRETSDVEQLPLAYAELRRLLFPSG